MDRPTRMSAQIIPFRNTHRKLFVDWMTFGNHYGPNGTEEEIRASWAKFYNQNEAAWRSQWSGQ